MKVSIYEEQPAKDKEREIILKLSRDDSGTVFVGVVDEKGNHAGNGTLIEFDKNMRLIRRENISEILGLPLNRDRQLVEGEGY